jgi:flagellar basal-body rod protein FlgB
MWMNNIMSGVGTGPLDQVIQFTEARHKVLANNIANIDTPTYKMRDLQLAKFQQDLAQAIEARSTGKMTSQGLPGPVDFQQYVLFHDQNNRSVEKQMTSLTENAILHNTTVELLRSRYLLLEKAISLKP